MNWSIAEGLPTARCAVVVNEGERALCWDVGASLKYKHSHMVSNLHLLETAKIVYTTGFFIISSFESILTLAWFAIENNKLFAINLSAVYICDSYIKELLEIIEFADCVFGNEDETSAFGWKIGLEFSDLHDVTNYISKLPKKNTSKPWVVTTTQGKNPVLCSIYNQETDELHTS